ncbi:unnamed protein product [Dovyalis caffra]|uniref:Uncharacterized protein n=1 Tax=Dovyalis caffra TaxID=77055 RepID=A0AAV1SLY4_9ROSI|nr:unnamed protein product [Dovyalis caffra]
MACQVIEEEQALLGARAATGRCEEQLCVRSVREAHELLLSRMRRSLAATGTRKELTAGDCSRGEVAVWKCSRMRNWPAGFIAVVGEGATRKLGAVAGAKGEVAGEIRWLIWLWVAVVACKEEELRVVLWVSGEGVTAARERETAGLCFFFWSLH